MKVTLPKYREQLPGRLIALLGDRSHFDATWPLAWTVSQYGETLIHVSGLWLAIQLKIVTGYATREAMQFCREYLAEARRSYESKLAPLEKYPWGTHLSRHWTPMRFQLAGMERLYNRLTKLRSGSILGDSVGLGKSQPLKAKVLTPTGWKRMGDLQVGDRVIGSSGKPVRVTGVFDQGLRPVVQVKLTDRTVIECDREHLWATNTSDRNARRMPHRVYTTAEIAKTLRWGGNLKQLRHFIPVLSSPAEFTGQCTLPLHPYVIGALLGDGGLSQHSVMFSTSDAFILKKMDGLLPCGVFIKRVPTSKYDYRIRSMGGVGRSNIVRAALRDLGLTGLRSIAKYIPDQYLFASTENRLHVLQGLMDTDGSAYSNGYVEFCSVSRSLASDVAFLVQSLGGVAKVSLGKSYCHLKTGDRVRCNDRYRVGVVMPVGLCPFSLPRKADMYRSHKRNGPSRAIHSVTDVGEKLCRCISVDAPDQLYVTAGCAVTHNTIQTIGLISRLRAERRLGNGVGHMVLVATTLSLKSQWKDEIEKFAKPRIPVLMIDGSAKERVRRFQEARRMGIVIINHEMMRGTYRELCEELRPRLLVIDETYKIANPSSALSQSMMEFSKQWTEWVLCFNATPIDNGLADMYPQVKVVDRAMLGDHEGFVNRYIKINPYTGCEEGIKNVPEFRKRIAAVMLRRTHAECGTQMPEVVSQVRPCQMSKMQFAAYVTARGILIQGSKNRAPPLNLLHDMRYAAFAADVNDAKSESCKYDELVSLVRNELVDQRVVVFTRYARIAKWLVMRGQADGLRIRAVTGASTNRERNDLRRRFNSDLGRGMILVGTEAMQHGLNLQSAGVIVNLDLPWTPGKLRQRIGRIARIGQHRATVLHLNFMAVSPSGAPTIDRYFTDTVMPRKQFASDAVFGGDGVDVLGADDLAARDHVNDGVFTDQLALARSWDKVRAYIEQESSDAS